MGPARRHPTEGIYPIRMPLACSKSCVIFLTLVKCKLRLWISAVQQTVIWRIHLCLYWRRRRVKTLPWMTLTECSSLSSWFVLWQTRGDGTTRTTESSFLFRLWSIEISTPAKWLCRQWPHTRLHVFPLLHKIWTWTRCFIMVICTY